jgi:hypothetical protein
MCVVLYTVTIVYICAFVTFSASYCLCYTIMNPRNVCMYVCTSKYARMCVCMYVCMYVCLYVCGSNKLIYLDSYKVINK